MTQRTYWASPIGSAPCDTWYSILDKTNIRKESTAMGAKTIIRQKTIRYHHLDDIRVTEIITKVSLLRKSGSPRTEGMRRIVEESGCGINTIYRLARLSDVELKKWDIRKADYVTHHHEMSADAAIYKRRRNKITSLANGSKRSKCDAFIRSCLAYIRESRIHTIDEAVNTIGRNYTERLYVPRHSITG